MVRIFRYISRLAAKTREQADAVRALPNKRALVRTRSAPRRSQMCTNLRYPRDSPIVVKPAAGWLNPKLRVSIVHSEQDLVDGWHRAGGSQNPNLLLQEYIPPGADWFFHGYYNGASDCLAGFTGMKLRSYPPHAGMTTLGRSITNDVLLQHNQTLLKAISYAGIMDLDFRFDERDRQYKLLDFNPRIGARFRVFVDGNGLDVARALYCDLTGQTVRRSKQVDGRILIVEPDDAVQVRTTLGGANCRPMTGCVHSRVGRSSPGSTGMIPCLA